MNTKARRFIEDWIAANIRSGVHDYDELRAAELAEQCRSHAADLGIPPEQLDEVARVIMGGGGDLPELIRSEIELADDDDTGRPAEKDD